MTELLASHLLAAALLAGTGGLHCAAMCGGIASTLTFTIPASAREGKKLWGWQFLFGTGRVSTYMLLGAGAGALGDTLLRHLSSEHYNWPALLSGTIMLLLAIQLLGKQSPLMRLEKLGSHVWRRVQPFLKGLMPVDHPLKALAFGGLWGFMPCGLLYSALMLAAATTNPITGALTMFVFGIITIPPVASAGVFAGKLRHLREGVGRPIALILVLLVAGVFFYQAYAHSHHGHDHDAHELHDTHQESTPLPTHH
ncbi:MAG TPA: sulfite exporter TauE/SafE family protein [Alcanivoracaceae bacterium]|nr:sulfite exporter TauE/SafE family protein [Alcanivoracaceae bacterium]